MAPSAAQKRSLLTLAQFFLLKVQGERAGFSAAIQRTAVLGLASLILQVLKKSSLEHVGDGFDAGSLGALVSTAEEAERLQLRSQLRLGLHLLLVLLPHGVRGCGHAGSEHLTQHNVQRTHLGCAPPLASQRASIARTHTGGDWPSKPLHCRTLCRFCLAHCTCAMRHCTCAMSTYPLAFRLPAHPTARLSAHSPALPDPETHRFSLASLSSISTPNPPQS